MTIAELDLENLPRVEVLADNLIRSEVSPGAWLWEGTANGVYVNTLTTDPDADVQVRGMASGLRFGAYLVDARTDTVLTFRYLTAW